MNERGISIMVGLAVLVFAAAFVVGHYRREHRRARLYRQLEYSFWYWRKRRD